MKITALAENELAQNHPDLRAEFGLSLRLEHRDHRILFDTGAAGAAVLDVGRLGIDLGAIDAVVLSHHHFDQGGGLPEGTVAADCTHHCRGHRASSALKGVHDSRWGGLHTGTALVG